jgi:hypothetical protein
MTGQDQNMDKDEDKYKIRSYKRQIQRQDKGKSEIKSET